MANALTYQSEFTGQQMDERFTAVATLTAALEALTGVVAQKYVKPSDGIPSTDMTAAVQASLAKAESAVQSLADYYTKTEVDQLLAAINGMDYVDVAALPTASASTMGKIYLVGPDGSGYYSYYYTSYDGSAYSWVGPLGTTEISLANYATKAELNQLDQELNGAVTETQRPTATWFNDYTFSSGWGSNADKIYFDIRNIVDENHKIVKFKIYRLNSGTMKVYFLKQSDYSIVTYKEVEIGPNNGVHTYDLTLEDSYYANGPMIVGICSDFTWGHKNQTNEFPNSYDLVMSTGVVTNQPSRGWGYGIVVQTHADGIADKVEKLAPGNNLADILANSDDDIILGPYDYQVTTPIVLSSGMTIRGTFGKTRLILSSGCTTAITASNANNIKISDLEIVGTCPNYSYEMNGIIAGTGYDLVETESDALALRYMGTEKGINLYKCENVVIDSVKINHITGSALYVDYVGRDYIKGMNVSNIFITNCYNGIFCTDEHEFSQYTNWTVTLCMIGIYIASGNLIFTAGHATRCRVGMLLVGGVSNVNANHGIITGVELKHNQIAGLLCSDVDYGELFDALYVSYAAIIARDCTGLYFGDLICGNNQIDFTGESGTNRIDNLIRRSYVTLDNVEGLTIANDVTLF